MSDHAFICRSCNGTNAHVILDMGALPLANAFAKSKDDDVDRFRAQQTLVMCDNCQLLQLRENVDREELFRDYLWVTGTSEASAKHAPWLATWLAERYLTPGNNFLVEIASNDGFFLEHYRDVGFRILGVDPSNVAADANSRELPTIQEFFGNRVAQRIVEEHGKAAVVVARNVLGHSSELRDLIRGVDTLLATDGHLLIEHPYVYFMHNECQYDQIFHEHVSYPSIQAVSNLIEQFGFKILSVSFVQMNGGSMLVEAVRTSNPAPHGGVEMMNFERFIGLNNPDGWTGFRNTVTDQKMALTDLLHKFRDAGRTVSGYGAAAKSMVMLNYCGIDTELVSVFADANPKKQGLLCPGVRIPVVSPDEMLAMNPDYILIGAWNLKEEIIRQLREDKGFGGKFIIPLPLPSIV